ncbi:MAG: response regulator transcription factor [Verrucomicrobiales bacterium]|nr:response regulator transcription factor [Verrucomicrobiales bacterium]
MPTSGSPSPAALPRVLLVDDDRKLCRLLRDYLGPMGYDVHAVHDGPSGVDAAKEGPWHAIVLDVMMPGLDGFEVLRRIRRDSDVPVLMLTARGDEADRIVGLEMGADDYLPKTFSPRELLARLRAVTRRSRPAAAAPATESTKADLPVVVGDLHVHPATRTVVVGDKPVELTAVEFDLLLSLARAPGRVKTREQLLEEVRERDYEVFDRSVDVHVSALRKKLGDDPRCPRFIETVRSVGYRLIHPEAAP